MFKIELLKNHPYAIPAIGGIWHEVLGKVWMPEIKMDEIISLYHDECNEDVLPIAYVSLLEGIPVGSCSLQMEGGIKPELGPWIGDVIVDPKYQKQGIGKSLINKACLKAKELGFSKLYLFTFDHNLPVYYQRLGWKVIGEEEFISKPVIVMEMLL